MNRSILYAVTAIALLFSANTAFAVGPCCCFCEEGRCQVDVDVEEVDVKCFDVECKTICIPPLRFPWECGPLKKCGSVRKIHVLTTDKKKKKVCTYDWSAITCCPSCYRSARKHCSKMGCCDSGCSDSCDSSTGCFSSAGQESDYEVVSDELQASDEELAAFAARYPDVSVELIGAIGNAKPDADGWVRVSGRAPESLTADDQLIETFDKPVVVR